MDSSAALIRQLKEDTVVRYPRDVEEALSELSTQQRKFAVLYASGEPQHEAYRIAYGNPNQDSARSAAHRLMRESEPVRTAVQRVQNWVESKLIQDQPLAIDFCSRKWVEWANGSDTSAAIRATELIAKAAGLFVSRSEITHRHVVELDQADSQLRSLLADLGVQDTIDAVFHVEHPVEQLGNSRYLVENKGLVEPSIGATGGCCPTCGRPIEEDARA